MKECQNLVHTRWDCTYHVVFISNGRRKAIFGAVRKRLRGRLHELTQQKEYRIVEGHLMPSNVRKHFNQALVELCRGIYPEQEWRRDCPEVFRQDEEFHGVELLGRRLLCLIGRAGRRNGAWAHQAPRSRGRTIRQTQSEYAKSPFGDASFLPQD